MKLTNKQLKQIIKEELQNVLNEDRDKINKLSDYIVKGDKEALLHGIELLKTAELEPWHRAELYSAIKSHLPEIRKRIEKSDEDLNHYDDGLRGHLWQYPVSHEDWEKGYAREEARNIELKKELAEIEDLLSKFKTNDMVYVDDPMMESKK